MNKSATRYFSSKQEKAVARTIKGNVVPNSGAIRFGAGDVQLDDWLVECKTKTSPSKSMSIQREWLEKNEEEAFSLGKEHSVLCFDFGDLHNSQRYYILSEREFKRLLEIERRERDEENE